MYDYGNIYHSQKVSRRHKHKFAVYKPNAEKRYKDIYLFLN